MDTYLYLIRSLLSEPDQRLKDKFDDNAPLRPPFLSYQLLKPLNKVRNGPKTFFRPALDGELGMVINYFLKVTCACDNL